MNQKQQSQKKQQNQNPRPAREQIKCPEYPSIQQPSNQTYLQLIHDHNFDKQQIKWVATQKVHGINVSIHCLGQHIRYGNRLGFTTQNIQFNCENAGEYYKQPYHDIKNVVNKYHKSLTQIKNNLSKLIKGMTKFSIYGEYFGGLYPNIKNKLKHVQLGVYYIPHHQFIAFDVLIFTQDKSFWLDIVEFPKIFQQHIPYVQIYAKGSFKQMLNINTKIDSTIPNQFGFQQVKNNLIQGFVIRPERQLILSDGDRVIVKIRNDKQFSQFAMGKPYPKQYALQGEVAGFVSSLQVYVTKEIIDKSIEKWPQCKTNHNKLRYEINRVARFHANKNQYKEAEGEQLIKKVNLQFERKIAKAVQKYFKK